MSGLDQYSRIVLKIGSSLLVDGDAGQVRQPWLSTIVEDIAELHHNGVECVLVSSGSVGLGKHALGYTHTPLRLHERQSAAAVGQIRLMETYSHSFQGFDIKSAQVLFSLADKDDPVYYANAAETLTNLIGRRVVPIINENDAIAPQEFQQRDNDRLAAYVSQMINADLLVLFSDVNGLYTGNPRSGNNAVLIPEVQEITDGLKAMAETASSGYGTGGMVTKLLAARIATDAGAAVILCNGQHEHPVSALRTSREHTVFHSRVPRSEDRAKWIEKLLKDGCRIQVNREGERAVGRRTDLRLGHIAGINGTFSSGDAVELVDRRRTPLGMGVVGYPSDELNTIRRFERQIHEYLGPCWDDKVIRHNHLVGAPQ